MTNQQLKAHCEDVIANPQDHLDWVVDMARVALASLEAKPVAMTEKHEISNMNYTGLYMRSWPINYGQYVGADIPIYTAPPVPVPKPIELPKPYGMQDFDKWLRQDEVIEAIRAAGYEVKSL
jgi:hypothetical protein